MRLFPLECIPGGGKAKANPSFDLFIAALSGNIPLATQLILEKKANINYVTASQNETPLHAAAQNGHTKMVNLLLEHGAKINMTDKYSRTPMDAAFIAGHIKLAEKLKAKGGQHLSPDIEFYMSIQEDIELYKGLSLKFSGR